ncbi:MAG TPA: endonuclease/exonuclease/phosphatase family protein [Opitutaceae bacterium]|nr:endonuclease/exonuclease/phosphatase family protein [Opitutaceae bacterium]
MVRIILGLLAAPAVARAETLTIATYNVENYVAADRMTEDGYRRDYPKPEGEKTALRTVIRSLHADILVLEEMGPAAYLEELRGDLKADGLDYPSAILLEGPDADRHVALLARRAPKAVKPHADLAFPYFGGREKVKRGLLEATFATEGGDLTLFAVHLKSRFTDRADDPLSALRRNAEALAVREAVLARFPDPAAVRFILLGDCNDTKDSRAVQSLLARGKMEVAALLPAADSRGDSWTYFYRKEDSYSRIDHILVSPVLRAAVVGNGARICDLPETRAASDHRPVTVTLRLEREKQERKLREEDITRQ